MSVYFDDKRKWWKYEFRYQKNRYTKSGFKTKKEASKEEAEKRKELNNPTIEKVSTDMAFLTLINLRLDYLKAYKSDRHYTDTVYLCKRWIKKWGKKTVSEITPLMIQSHLFEIRRSISAETANKELRSLRSVFNFGIKHPNRWFQENPTTGIEFFPVEIKKKYVPPVTDVLRVILAAQGEVQDYLWTIALTLGRMSEINRLEWKDVDFDRKIVTLYTRKTKGGNLKPRDIPMTEKLYDVLWRRYKTKHHSWVFYHTYRTTNTGEWVTGPYKDRKRIMSTLCKKVGIKYFRFHPLRHFGASMLEKEGVSTRVIQDLLGHENRSTTEIYLHSFSGSDRKAMNLLSEALNTNNRAAEI